MNKWIPIGKALPKENENVLATAFLGKGKTIIVTDYSKEHKHWKDGTILAWMPLPEPYEEEWKERILRTFLGGE